MDQPAPEVVLRRGRCAALGDSPEAFKACRLSCNLSFIAFANCLS
jgi:hypothetical protein